MTLFDSSGFKLAKSLTKRLANYRHELLVARPARHDDLYVVSFPKSGATWMNFLMANIHLRESKVDRAVTFFNVHDFIPDIHSTRDIRSDILPFPGYRVIKSHAEYNPYYQKVVYVVRDPRDVMVSFFHFLRGLGSFEGDISVLVRSPKYGINAWCKHVRSWLALSPETQNLMFVRYEDLKKDTPSTIKGLYALLGHQVDDALLQAAIEASSFENMRALERDYGYGGRDVSRTLKLMRKGEAGSWKEEVPRRDAEYIKQVAADWMAHFGYE